MRILKTAYRKFRWNFFWNCFQLPDIDLESLVPNTEPIMPPIVDHLCLPPYEGPVDHNDVIPLLSLVRAANPRTVLELGTAHGATVANICALSDAQVYTVNALPEQISGNAVTFVLSREEIGYVYRKYNFADRVVQIYENTKNVNLLDYMPANSVDLAIIDACHDSDFVVNDFFKVLPVLNENAIVIFHDVHPNMKNHLRESYIACMYLRKCGYDVQHLKNTWWGIWRANSDKPALALRCRVFNEIDNLLVKMRQLAHIQDVLYLRWLAGLYIPPKQELES